MMKMRTYIVYMLLLVGVGVQAQHITQIIDPNIRTLRVRTLSEALEPNGDVQRPYLVLPESGGIDGSDWENTLEISFDYLSHDTKQYTYKVLHCDRYWKESQISSYEYLDGFTTNDIVDYELSMNTQQEYTHYRLEFPNADMQLKASGNYVLQIYQDGDQDKVVAQVCMQVVEPLAEVSINIRHNTDIELSGRYQQLDIDVQTSNLNVRDAQDVCLQVTQNGRLDNRVMIVKPTYVEPKRLRYINQKALIFEGGNEFRRFDSYSTYYGGYHVGRIAYQQGDYCAVLDEDMVRGIMAEGAGREGLGYLTDVDANGQWVVNCEKTDYPDVEAEYMWVHFTLPVKQPLVDKQVFVGGDLFYNQYTMANLMQYDADAKCYYLYAFLKQGGYNYMYYTKGANGSLNLLPIEGSHWQTKNEYAVDVYFRPFGARYDRLVGKKITR